MIQCILSKTRLWLLGGEYIVKNQNGMELAIKKNEILIHATTWMNLKNMTLHERNQMVKWFIL